MRIDTDRFIVCDNCQETDHFGNVSIARATEWAKQSGWKTRKGAPVCPDCLDMTSGVESTKAGERAANGSEGDSGATRAITATVEDNR